MHPIFDKFLVHNQHWESPSRFAEADPHLKRLSGLPYVYRSPLIDTLAAVPPGVYLLDAGREIGKSTLINELLGFPIQATGQLFLCEEGAYGGNRHVNRAVLFGIAHHQ